MYGVLEEEAELRKRYLVPGLVGAICLVGAGACGEQRRVAHGGEHHTRHMRSDRYVSPLPGPRDYQTVKRVLASHREELRRRFPTAVGWGIGATDAAAKRAPPGGLKPDQRVFLIVVFPQDPLRSAG